MAHHTLLVNASGDGLKREVTRSVRDLGANVVILPSGIDQLQYHLNGGFSEAMNKATRWTMRRGDISPAAVLALVSVVAVVALAYMTLTLRPDARRSKSDSMEIRVYCASGIVEPVELALRSYRAQFDIDVSVVQTGGSGKLFGQIKTEFQSGVTRGADIYISADESLVDRGHEQGVISERIPMAIQRPVIATHVDFVHTTGSLSQLVVSADDLRIGIANESAAIGRLARDIAQHEGVLNELLERRKLETENVMQLAQALQTKTVDAAVIWDATVAQVNRQHGGKVLKIVARIGTPTASASGRVTLGIVSNTPHPTAALRVARFLVARDGGLPFLKDAGFEVVDGDRWEEMLYGHAASEEAGHSE